MFRVETELESDGRWLAEVPALPGLLTYGKSHAEAIRKAQILTLRVFAERIENSEHIPEVENIFAIQT